jgi:hypothetical protein
VFSRDKSLNLIFLPFLQQKEQLRPEFNAQKGLEMQNSFMAISSNNDEDDRINQVNRVINKRKFIKFI